MPVTINGNGHISGLAVGGLPNGTVDADTLATNSVTTVKLADNSVTHAKSTGLQRRISTGPTTMSGSLVTLNVTAGVKKIELFFTNVSSNGSSDMEIQLGDSGGIESSGYGYAAGYHRTGVSSREATVAAYTAGFTTNGFGSASYQIWGNWKMWNTTGNTWIAEHIMWGSLADNHTFYGNGYKELSGTLTQFTIAPISGAFDTGSVTMVETMGDD